MAVSVLASLFALDSYLQYTLNWVAFGRNEAGVVALF